MTYSLIQLAPGAYDLLLRGEIIGSVVQTGQGRELAWTAELLEDLPPGHRPPPFFAQEHEFRTLEELCHWLGNAQVRNSRRSGSLTTGS